jgi:hypothetical protein
MIDNPKNILFIPPMIDKNLENILLDCRRQKRKYTPLHLHIYGLNLKEKGILTIE